MKRIILKRLTLSNWKALTGDFSFNENGTTIIRGKNKAGKSHIIDAYCWLLTGVDTDDRSNYDLFDKKKEFTYENAVPAVVKGIFSVDGIEYSFTRHAKQKWTRPRNSAEYVKDKSDEYKYYVDDLEVSANEYKARVAEIFMDIEKLKLVTNIRAIQSMDWKVRRKHFADMVGEVKESDFQGDYATIEPLLQKYRNTANTKEKLRQELTPLNNQEKDIESEIKALKSLLPDISQCESAKQQIADKKQQIKEIDSEIIGIGNANAPFIEKRNAEEKAIFDAKQGLSDAKYQYNQKTQESISDIETTYRLALAKNKEAEGNNAMLSKRRKSLQSNIASVQVDIDYLSESKADLKKQKEAVKARLFTFNDVCPTCGQKLPYDEEKVALARTKFDEVKRNDLLSIVERGKATAARLSEREAYLEELKKELEALVPCEVEDISELKSQLDAARAKIIPFEQTDEYKKGQECIKELEDTLTVIPETQDASELQQQKQSLLTDVEMLSMVVARKDEFARVSARIEQKQDELRENGIAKAKVEGLLSKVMEREREWADIVKQRANKYLKRCHVEMLEIAKSGELNDICSVSIDGVDINTTNTADRVIAGCDIAEAFMDKYGIIAPIIIDNAEQVTDDNIPQTEGQLVLMYVDKSCEQLTFQS